MEIPARRIIKNERRTNFNLELMEAYVGSFCLENRSCVAQVSHNHEFTSRESGYEGFDFLHHHLRFGSFHFICCPFSMKALDL